jgi:hypothetical protein
MRAGYGDFQKGQSPNREGGWRLFTRAVGATGGQAAFLPGGEWLAGVFIFEAFIAQSSPPIWDY